MYLEVKGTTKAANDCVALLGGDKLDNIMSILQKVVWELEE